MTTNIVPEPRDQSAMIIRRGIQTFEPLGEALDMDADRLAMRLGIPLDEALDTLRARDRRRAEQLTVELARPMPNWWGDDEPLWNAKRKALWKEWMDAIQNQGCEFDFNEWLQPDQREEWQARPVALVAALLAIMGGEYDQAGTGQEAN